MGLLEPTLMIFTHYTVSVRFTLPELRAPFGDFE